MMSLCFAKRFNLTLLRESRDLLWQMTTGMRNPIRYSCYGPHFQEPIYKRAQLQNLKETGDGEKLAHFPIKAAQSEQTCSPFYDSVLEKFINYAMRKGNKELARFNVNKALETIKRTQVSRYNKESNPELKANINLDALDIFHKAVLNCKPLLQLTPIKRGGSTYQVPVPVSDKRATFLAMNWLIEQGKGEPRKERFYIKLASELINASLNQGKVVKRKQDLHRLCEANRAYAHYRWS